MNAATTNTATGAGSQDTVRERSLWRAVAIPSEHGGWGLTGEPVLLGLLIAFSWSGIAIGIAAVVGFLVRTPLKLAVVDRRRSRSLPRTRLAIRIAAAESALLAALAIAAITGAGWAWLIPIGFAAPLIGVEFWFDIRSRGRRLVPELGGAIGITAVAASIVIAGDGEHRTAAAAALVLAGRAISSIPFVRTQIVRLRHGRTPLRSTLLFQAGGVATAGAATAFAPEVAPGAIAVAVVTLAQVVWLHRSVPPAKVIGLRQMFLGLAIVVATVVGVHTIS